MAITKQRVRKIEKGIDLVKEGEEKFSLLDLHSNDPVIAARADRILCKMIEEHWRKRREEEKRIMKNKAKYKT